MAPDSILRLAVAAADRLAFLGLGHYWRRQYDSAAHWADSAITVEPNYLLGGSTVGYIAIERGDYRRARAAFEAARRLTTDIEAINSAAATALADARAGALPEARDLLQQAESKAIGHAATSLHTSVYMAQCPCRRRGHGSGDRLASAVHTIERPPLPAPPSAATLRSIRSRQTRVSGAPPHAVAGRIAGLLARF